MKHIILFFYICLVFASCSKQDSYVIHGDLRCVNAKQAILFKQNALGEIVMVDSTPIKAGTFIFKGRVNMPTMMFLQIGKRQPIDLFVENEEINVSGSILLPKEIKVEGSQSHDDFVYLQNEMIKIKNKKESLMIDITNAKKQNDYVTSRTLSERYDVLSDSILIITKSFVENNKTSVGAAYFTCMLEQNYDISRLSEIIDLFDDGIAESEYVSFLEHELLLTQKLITNVKAPQFSITSYCGDTLVNDKFLGNYLFIDFWASWNSDSKERRAWLYDLYRKYKRSGLKVMSVSIDVDKNKWRASVDSTDYNWIEACDFKYWGSPITKCFRVKSIPYGVLLDSYGRVIAINPRRYILDNKLKSIFGY